MKCSISIKNTDAGEMIQKIQCAFNNAAWSKATRPLLDEGKVEHSVNIKFQWENRRRLKRHVSTVERIEVTRVQVQTIRDPGGTVQGADKIDKSSNKCLPTIVMT